MHAASWWASIRSLSRTADRLRVRDLRFLRRSCAATAEQIIKTGAVHHGYLGISLNDVTPANASFFKLNEATGAIVAQVSPDSPASLAGLKNGDVISAVDGEKVVNGSALQVAVSEKTPGTEISLGIIRNGAPQTVQVKVGEYKKDTEMANDGDAAGPQKGKLGLAVAELTPDVRQQLAYSVAGKWRGCAERSPSESGGGCGAHCGRRDS